MTTKTDNSNKIIAAILIGVVGLGFVGFQTSAKNQQSNIDNLPAVLARLESVEARQVSLSSVMDNLRQSNLSESTLNAKLEAVNEKIDGIEGQVIRRIQEVVKEPLMIVRHDVEKNEDFLVEMAIEQASIRSAIEKAHRSRDK